MSFSHFLLCATGKKPTRPYRRIFWEDGTWVSADLSLLQPKDKDNPEAGATKRGAVPTSGPYLTPAISNFSYKDDHSLTLNLYPVFS